MIEFQLSAFADEASADFSEQIKVLQEERIPMIELRGLDGKNVSELDDAQAETYAGRLRENGISVWAIGSPIGKIKLCDDFSAHLRLCERIFRTARIFGTEKVRVFSFYTDEPEKDGEEVIRRMLRVTELAKEYGIVLYHENEKGIYGVSAANCLTLLKRVPGLHCVLDPANFIQCGEKIPAALSALQGRIGYYHIKDCLVDTGEIVPAGEGDGCIGTIIDLAAEGSVFTVEPHLAVFEGYSQIDHTQLKNRKCYASAREAFAVAVQSLRYLFRQKGFREENQKWIK